MVVSPPPTSPRSRSASSIVGEQRPIIGVTCYVEAVDRDPWVAQRSVVLPHAYVAHIEQAGGIALVLPPRLDVDEAMVNSLLDRLDGVILAGGADVESTRYAAPPHPTSQSPRPDRDAWELALAQATSRRGVPTLGICRGMQVMAVAAGARLEQHVPDRVGGHEHSPEPGRYSVHPIRAVAGSRLAEIVGPDELDVPTYHHQAVIPDSLVETVYRASAWHADDTLEGMEDPRAPFRIAVQWHPEVGQDPRLFQALVAAAR